MKLTDHLFRFGAAILLALSGAMIWTPSHAAFPASDTWCRAATAGYECGSKETRQAVYTAWVQPLIGNCAGPNTPPGGFTVYAEINNETTIAFNFHTRGCDGSVGPYYNTAGGLKAGWNLAPGQQSCPANSTLSGGQCTCSANFNEVNGTCVAKQVCDWAKDMQVAGGSFMIETGKNFCHSGCTFVLAPDAGSSPFRAKQDGKWYEQRYQGDFKGTGTGASNCGVGDVEEEPAIDPPEDKPEPPKQTCPPGQTAGAQIIAPGGGGGYVCNTPEETESKKKTVVEKTEPDGSTSTTATEQTTICGTNSCNTTTSTSVSSGGTTTTKTESATQGKDDFCKSNPSDKNCTGSGGGGTGTAAGDQSSPDHPKLWERKYPDGLAGVWAAKKTALLNTDIGKLAPSLMPNNIPQNAALPVWNLPLDFGPGMNYGSHNVAPTAEIWGWAKIFLIISALLLARALIFGG